MVPEASLERTAGGLVPAGEGWFVLNVQDARWFDGGELGGLYTSFEGAQARFAEIGFGLGILRPGEANALYHGEEAEEDFLVLAGECLLLVEGQERRLRAWDFVHCPPWTEHIFVGAGEGPCLVLAVGARSGGHEMGRGSLKPAYAPRESLVSTFTPAPCASARACSPGSGAPVPLLRADGLARSPFEPGHELLLTAKPLHVQRIRDPLQE